MSLMQKATTSLAPRFLKAAAGCSQQQIRNLNLLEYQAKGLLQNYGVTVQKFKVQLKFNLKLQIKKNTTYFIW